MSDKTTLTTEDQKKAINLQDLVYVKQYINNKVPEQVNNVINEDYYTKTEVDDKISSDCYTKTETDTQITTINNAISNVYTKSETNAKIDDIGRSSPVDKAFSCNYAENAILSSGNTSWVSDVFMQGDDNVLKTGILNSSNKKTLNNDGYVIEKKKIIYSSEAGDVVGSTGITIHLNTGHGSVLAGDLVEVTTDYGSFKFIVPSTFCVIPISNMKIVTSSQMTDGVVLYMYYGSIAFEEQSQIMQFSYNVKMLKIPNSGNVTTYTGAYNENIPNTYKLYRISKIIS